MALRVSVIVPAYNPGEWIEPLIASLGKQTMPGDEFEVIFVDDGSTDDTPARLDRLTAEAANVRVIHQANSGWAGKPRNVGIDAARGKYVFFADSDDWFGPEALQRLADFADTCKSDIVIGRYAGHHRGVAKALFAKSYEAATLASAPLMDSLTSMKLYRVAFLNEHHLRFPEERRRLEDHVFVVRAYFLASRISVLSDYHCYFHTRGPGGGLSTERLDPAGYYRSVREVVGIILEHSTPGALQDRCLRRPLRQEMLGRLDGRAFLAEDLDYQRDVFEQARAVALDLLPTSVDDGLAAPQRARAALLRAGALPDLLALVEHQVDVRCSARLDDLQWDEQGRLVLEVEAQLSDGRDGPPWTYRREGSDVLLTVPPLSTPVPRAALECTAAFRNGKVALIARRREDSEEWPIPTESRLAEQLVGDAVWASYRATARLDPLTLGGGRALTTGVWDLYVKISQTGWSKEARLGAQRSEQATAGAAPALRSAAAMVPYWTADHDNLSLDVGVRGDRLAKRLRLGAAACRLVGDPGHQRVQLDLPLAIAEKEPPAGARISFEIAHSRRSMDVEAELSRFGPASSTLTAELPRLKRGTWRILFVLGVPGWGAPRPSGAALRCDRSNLRVDVVKDRVPAASASRAGSREPNADTSTKARLRHVAGRARRKLRRVLRRG